MPQLIDRLAELTGSRDRQQLDVAIVHAVTELLQPSLAVIFRTVGDGDDRRWLTGARMRRGDARPTADPSRHDVDTLPALDSEAERAACLRTARPVVVGTQPQTSHFPISTGREVIGVLELQTARPVTPADRATVTTLMRIFGNFHDLLDDSERDPLTGLLNRQSFNAGLMTSGRAPVEHPLDIPRKVDTDDGPSTPDAPDALDAHDPPDTPNRRQPPAASSQWLGIVDIDFFKRVNDNFGHPIGDEVLLLLSRLLQSTFRHFDRLFRFGGEEFVVVLECANAGQAALAFERLRGNVERYRFPQVGRVTISTGFTELTALDTPSGAVARADKALYHVKQNGRNQVAQFESLVGAGLLVSNEVVGGIELF